MVSLTKLILSEYILVFFLVKIHLYYMYFCMVSETQIGPLSSRKIVANGGGWQCVHYALIEHCSMSIWGEYMRTVC